MSPLDATAVITDLLASGHSVRFRVHGDSMAPLLRSDDSLQVEPVDPAAVRRGDVVLVLAERGLTAHRVIALDEETARTRGDNAPAEDPPISRSRLIGRIVWLEREGRTRRVRRLNPAALFLFRALARVRLRLTGR